MALWCSFLAAILVRVSTWRFVFSDICRGKPGDHHRNWRTEAGDGRCSPCGYVNQSVFCIAVNPDRTLPYVHDLDVGDIAGQAENAPGSG